MISDAPRLVLNQLGTTYTLRRKTVTAGANSWTAGTETVTYFPQIGNRRISASEVVDGNVRDPAAKLILHPDYTEPVIGDRLAAGTFSSDAGVEWLEISFVDKVIVENVLAKYVVTVRQ